MNINKPQTIAYLFPFVAIVLWAGNVIVSRMSAHIIGPEAITFYRLLLAVLVMSTFVAIPVWRNREVIWPQLGKFVILGFLSMVFFQCLSYLAAETTTATNIAVFTAMTPLLTVALSSMILNVRPTVGIVAGGILSFVGLTYLVSSGNPISLIHHGMHLGDPLMFLAAVIYALYGVLLKRWNLPVTGWQSTYMQAICALVIMIPAFLATPASLRALNYETLPLIVYAGVLASVVLPFLWVRGIDILGPNRCSIFMNLLPVMTAAIAIVLLDEPVHSYHVIGGGIALVGVTCTLIFPRPLRSRSRRKSKTA